MNHSVLEGFLAYSMILNSTRDLNSGASDRWSGGGDIAPFSSRHRMGLDRQTSLCLVSIGTYVRLYP